MKDKNYYNELKEKREWLIRCFNSSLSDYRELQSWFKRAKTPSDAEFFFRKFKEAEWCQMWNDWEFDRGHRTLKARIKENREERNEIIEKIKLIKELMKTYQRSNNGR